jgi:hypothetical protein
LAVVALAAVAGCSWESDRVVGTWEGVVRLPRAETDPRFVVHITKDEKGKLSGTVDSVEGKLSNAPAAVELKEGHLHLTVPSVQALYEAQLSHDGQEFVGQWRQGMGAFPLTLRRMD